MSSTSTDEYLRDWHDRLRYAVNNNERIREAGDVVTDRGKFFVDYTKQIAKETMSHPPNERLEYSRRGRNELNVLGKTMNKADRDCIYKRRLAEADGIHERLDVRMENIRDRRTEARMERTKTGIPYLKRDLIRMVNDYHDKGNYRYNRSDRSNSETRSVFSV